MGNVKSGIYKGTTYCQYGKRCKYGTKCPKVLRKEEWDLVKFNYVIKFMKERPECFRRKKRNNESKS